MPINLEQSQVCQNRTNSFDHPDIPDDNRFFGLTYAIVQWTYYSVFMLWYVIRRRSSPYLRERMVGLVLLTAIYFCFEASWSLREFIGREYFPCAISQPSILIAFYLGLIPQVIRIFIFWRRIEFSKIAAEELYYRELKESYLGGKKIIGVNRSGNPIGGFEIGASQGGETSFSSSREKRKSLVNTKAVVYQDEQVLSNKSEFESGLDDMAYMDQIPGEENANEAASVSDSEKNRQRTFKFKKLISNNNFGWFLFLIASIIFWPTIVDSVGNLLRCYGCENLGTRTGEFIVSAVLFMICVAGVVYVLWRVRKEPDPLDHVTEFKRMMLSGLIVILIWICFEGPDVGDYYKDGLIYWGYLYEFSLVVMFTIMVPLQIYKSYVIDKSQRSGVLENNTLEFDREMESVIVRQNFKRHLMNENSLENYYFWAEIRQWTKIYDTLLVPDRIERFKFIYDVFIARKSLLEVNIHPDFRDDLGDISQKLVNGEQVDIEVDVFADAVEDVKRMMIFGPFRRFKKTSDYGRPATGTQIAAANRNHPEEF